MNRIFIAARTASTWMRYAKKLAVNEMSARHSIALNQKLKRDNRYQPRDSGFSMFQAIVQKRTRVHWSHVISLRKNTRSPRPSVSAEGNLKNTCDQMTREQILSLSSRRHLSSVNSRQPRSISLCMLYISHSIKNQYFVTFARVESRVFISSIKISVASNLRKNKERSHKEK